MHSFSEGRILKVMHNRWFITDYLYWKLNSCRSCKYISIIREFKFSVYWKEVVAFFVMGMYLLLCQHITELKVGSYLPYTSFSWLGIVKRRPSILMEAAWSSGWAEICSPLWLPAGFVSGSTWFNSLAALVHSQLICLPPVGILYLFSLFHWPCKAPMWRGQLILRT